MGYLITKKYINVPQESLVNHLHANTIRSAATHKTKSSILYTMYSYRHRIFTWVSHISVGTLWVPTRETHRSVGTFYELRERRLAQGVPMERYKPA